MRLSHKQSVKKVGSIPYAKNECYRDCHIERVYSCRFFVSSLPSLSIRHLNFRDVRKNAPRWRIHRYRGYDQDGRVVLFKVPSSNNTRRINFTISGSVQTHQWLWEWPNSPYGGVHSVHDVIVIYLVSSYRPWGHFQTSVGSAVFPSLLGLTPLQAWVLIVS